MNNGYELLVEKEAMWAQMLIQVLKDNNIHCVAVPIHGAGFVAKTGMQERLKIYVSSEKLQQASDFLQELFSEESV